MERLLDIFDKLAACLGQLADLSHQKTDAVRADNLLALDEVLKQEQALTLSIRGLESKNDALLKELGLKQVPLSALPERYPPELQLKAKQTVDNLHNQYFLYRRAAAVARNTLECNLHEIEKFLMQQGMDPSAGPGYVSPDLEPPAPMKTDIRI